MKKVLTAMLLVLGVLSAQAQETAEFTADRPGASTGPSVVGQGVVQLEQGIQYDKADLGKTFTFSNTLFRYGLFPNMELRVGGDFFKESGASAAFSGLSAGTKIKCFDDEGVVPAVSVLAEFAVPGTASSGYKTENLAPSLYLLFENPLNDRLSLGYNLGAEWDGSEPEAVTFVAVCLGCNVAENLGCFVEGYGRFGADDNAYAMDFGFNWMAGRKLQMDVAADINLKNPSKFWSVSCGLAWQINK